MTYAEIVRLYEKKEDIIKKTHMTDEQKQEVIEFFTKHREQENQISGDEWNKPESLTYERFKQVMDAFNNRNTKSHANKIANKVGITGLTEGKDYVDWGEFKDKLLGTFHAYTPLSHLGAKTIAGKTVKPYPEGTKDSAGWCIGWTGENSYWKNYFFKNKTDFLIICGENVPTKKVCFEIKENFGLHAVLPSESVSITVWNYYDRDKSFNDFLNEIEKIYDKNTTSDSKNTLSLRKTLFNLFYKAKETSDILRDDLLEEEERKKEEIQRYINSLPRIELKYKNSDFPLIKMGHRQEGDIYGSLFLIPQELSFSPLYYKEKYFFGCNHWDTSIVRQWLNSDAPAGQWYKKYDVDDYAVDWERTQQYIKDFIKNTDGFLKIIGLSKSQLNPVKNVTYTTEGEEIITEDYVWVPSLTELSTQNKYKEGEPLDYWKKLLGENASQDTNEFREMKVCYDASRNSFSNALYWTRSVSSECDGGVGIIGRDGGIHWYFAYYWLRLPILACFKSE